MVGIHANVELLASLLEYIFSIKVLNTFTDLGQERHEADPDRCYSDIECAG
jgi:hypothetical protein